MKQSRHQPLDDPLRRHTPERGTHRRKYLVLYSCCCCCCCCLHTLGSAIGAVVAGDCQTEPRAPRAQGMFWKCTFLVIGVALVGAALVGEFASMLLILAIFGPLFLLGASLLMMGWIALRPDLPSRGLYYRKSLSIVLGNIAGCVIGILAMFLIYVVMAGL